MHGLYGFCNLDAASLCVVSESNRQSKHDLRSRSRAQEYGHQLASGCTNGGGRYSRTDCIEYIILVDMKCSESFVVAWPVFAWASDLTKSGYQGSGNGFLACPFPILFINRKGDWKGA